MVSEPLAGVHGGIKRGKFCQKTPWTGSGAVEYSRAITGAPGACAANHSGASSDRLGTSPTRAGFLGRQQQAKQIQRTHDYGDKIPHQIVAPANAGKSNDKCQNLHPSWP